MRRLFVVGAAVLAAVGVLSLGVPGEAKEPKYPPPGDPGITVSAVAEWIGCGHVAVYGSWDFNPDQFVGTKTVTIYRFNSDYWYDETETLPDSRHVTEGGGGSAYGDIEKNGIFGTNTFDGAMMELPNTGSTPYTVFVGVRFTGVWGNNVQAIDREYYSTPVDLCCPEFFFGNADSGTGNANTHWYRTTGLSTNKVSAYHAYYGDGSSWNCVIISGNYNGTISSVSCTAEDTATPPVNRASGYSGFNVIPDPSNGHFVRFQRITEGATGVMLNVKHVVNGNSSKWTQVYPNAWGNDNVQ